MDTRGIVSLGKPANQVVDANGITEILTKYSTLWRETGLKLGLDVSVLNNIEADFSEQRKRFEVALNKWLALSGDMATWGVLELAITNANRGQLGLTALLQMPSQPVMHSEVGHTPLSHHQESEVSRHPVGLTTKPQWSSSVQRIKKEFRERIDPSDEAKNPIIIEPVDDKDYTKLKGTIFGPPDTPFVGGTYHLNIEIPASYPYHPPKINFITKIWHPNISSVTGAICMDILEDKWMSSLSVRTVLLSIQILLQSAEPDVPLDAVVANQYKEDPEMYHKTARYWAHIYAGAPYDSCTLVLEMKIRQVVRMGFSEQEACTALSNHIWNVQRAVESMLYD